MNSGKAFCSLSASPPSAGISQIKATHSSRAAQAGNGARWILMVVMTSGQMDYKLCTGEEVEAQDRAGSSSTASKATRIYYLGPREEMKRLAD